MRRTVTKSIAIIGEGETEWFYFDSLRVACRYPFKVAPDFPQHSDINHILAGIDDGKKTVLKRAVTDFIYEMIYATSLSDDDETFDLMLEMKERQDWA